MKVLMTCAVLFALIGCSASEPVVPSPQPRPVPAVPTVAQTPPPQALGEKWEDWPFTPGNWVYRSDAKGSLALFGKAGADADFLIRCVAASKKIYLSRAGAFAGGETGRMTVRASTSLKSYAVANADGAPAYVAAELDPRDTQLDAVAFSRGRFIISVKGSTDLVIPAWPEIARVVEDCRA
jgi:hypothetical protein